MMKNKLEHSEKKKEQFHFHSRAQPPDHDGQEHRRNIVFSAIGVYTHSILSHWYTHIAISYMYEDLLTTVLKKLLKLL